MMQKEDLLSWIRNNLYKYDVKIDARSVNWRSPFFTLKLAWNQRFLICGFLLKSFRKSKARLFKETWLWTKLLLKNELNNYLLKVQKEVNDLYERLVEEYKIQRDVTEELKQKDQMKWIQMMNNIKSCVDGFILLKIALFK